MTSKTRTLSELVDDNSKSLSPTQPKPEGPSEEVPSVESPKVANFDNSGNGVTDNKPLGWEEESPAGTVIYGADSAVPSENAVVSGTVSAAVYAGENEFDDKGLKDPDVTEPPVEETEPSA